MEKNRPEPADGYIDLHIHTNFSDGTYPPSEAVKMASSLGLKAISITDHDNVSGIYEAIRSGEENSVEVIPGIELSADSSDVEIHLLGYFIDWRNVSFRGRLDEMSKARFERAKNMVKKLNALGVKIAFEDVLAVAGKGSIGRLHLAKALKNKGFVGDIQEAFNRYIGKGRPAYADKYKITPEDAIALIQNVGGISVLAHPGLVKKDSVVPRLKEAGLDGIEVYHTEHAPEMVRHYKEMAEKYDLVATGGSDCHGHGKTSVLMGKVKVPYNVLTELKRYAAEEKR